MFFKKEETKQEVQPTQPAPKAEVGEVRPKMKVIYRIEDATGQGEWTINRAEVAKEQQLGVNEFPKILAAQRAVFADINARMKRLKEARARVKAIRKAVVVAS